MFESVTKLTRLKRHYVIMTGMGIDGASAMASAKQAGAASAIGEAKETCVVFGMPKSAIEYNCVDHIVPVDRIPSKIIEVTRKQNIKFQF
jgi:two-component system chemotaxis response regulator CheB